MTTNKKSSSEKPNKKIEKSTADKEIKRKIKPKNYVTLGIIFLLTFCLVLLLRNWYISYRDYRLTIPVLKGTLKEVNVSELDHYITANPDAIIYIEVSEDDNSREVAKGMKKVLKQRNLTDRVVYLNLSSVSDKEKFFDDFSKNYAPNKKINNYPALVLFIDGKIDSYVSRTDSQRLNIGNVEQLFDEYELEGE